VNKKFFDELVLRAIRAYPYCIGDERSAASEALDQASAELSMRQYQAAVDDLGGAGAVEDRLVSFLIGRNARALATDALPKSPHDARRERENWQRMLGYSQAMLDYAQFPIADAGEPLERHEIERVVERIKADLAQPMDQGITVLAGPFDKKGEAWGAEERINPEGWSGSQTPKVARGYDGKWYVIQPPAWETGI
jgi:hypothetical protein